MREHKLELAGGGECGQPVRPLLQTTPRPRGLLGEAGTHTGRGNRAEPPPLKPPTPGGVRGRTGCPAKDPSELSLAEVEEARDAGARDEAEYLIPVPHHEPAAVIVEHLLQGGGDRLVRMNLRLSAVPRHHLADPE